MLAETIIRHPMFFNQDAIDCASGRDVFAASWFRKNTSYKDNKWTVSAANGFVNIDWNQPIAPRLNLLDVPELLESVKLSVFLSRQMLQGMGGLQNGESQRKMQSVLLRVIRFMFSNNIKKLCNFNEPFFELYLERLPLPTWYLLNVPDKINKFQQYYIKNYGIENFINDFSREKGSNFHELNVNKLFSEIGVHEKLATSTNAIFFMNDFKHKNGFYIPKKLRSIQSEETTTFNTRKQSTIFKELTLLSKVFKQHEIFCDIFPASQCFANNHFSNLDKSIKDISFFYGVKKEKTKDIPYKLMVDLFEMSINWIFEYSPILFKARDEVWLCRKDYYNKRLDDKTVRRYLSAKLNSNILHDILSSVDINERTPWPFNGFINETGIKQKTCLSQSQTARAAESYERGETQLSILNNLKENGVEISKSTLSKAISRYRESFKPNRGSVPLQKALYRFLPTACFFIIYSFTGRRESEITLIDENALNYQDKTMTLYSAKILQEYDKFPINNLVVKAVEILQQLASTAENGKKRVLSIFPTLDKPQAKQGLNFSKCLNEMANIYIDNESNFELSDHQFRRFVAYMYYYGYKGDLATLSYHMRHKNWQMTLEYLRDEFGFSDVGDILCSKIIEFYKQSNLPTYVIDILGLENTEKVKEKLFSTNFEAHELGRVHKIIQKKIDEIGLVLHFINGFVCFGNTPVLARQSVCFNGVCTDTMNASVEMCSKCENGSLLTEPLWYPELIHNNDVIETFSFC